MNEEYLKNAERLANEYLRMRDSGMSDEQLQLHAENTSSLTLAAILELLIDKKIITQKEIEKKALDILKAVKTIMKGS